jgi:hypothetical protein
MAGMVKRGPRKKSKRMRGCKLRIVDSWGHCDNCRACTRMFPNLMTALRALPILGGDPALICINSVGSVHRAVPA